MSYFQNTNRWQLLLRRKLASTSPHAIGAVTQKSSSRLRMQVGTLVVEGAGPLPICRHLGVGKASKEFGVLRFDGEVESSRLKGMTALISITQQVQSLL
ncbi:hypothetical protein EV1_000660 [Malus domestica]